MDKRLEQANHQWPINDVKRCSIILEIRKCKLKQKCHSIPNQLAKVNQLTATRPQWKPSPVSIDTDGTRGLRITMPRVGEDVENQGHTLLVWVRTGPTAVQIIWQDLVPVGNVYNTQPSNPIAGTYPTHRTGRC